MVDITMGPGAPSGFVALINSFHREQQQPCNEQCICRAFTETLCNDLFKFPGSHDCCFEEINPSVLLPRLSALLVASKQWQAGIQVLEGFVRTEVSPQSSKLSSLDAAAHAAVVRTFLQMAWGLIIMQSGLLQELSQMVSDAFQLLDTCADTARDCLDEAQEPVMDRKDQVPSSITSMAKDLSAQLQELLPQLQLLFGWVDVLAFIQPGGMLAQDGVEGTLAANTLLLTARYLDLSVMLPNLADMDSSTEIDLKAQQQEQEQQQQGAQVQLPHLLTPSLANMLPTVTAAAMKTTSALLQDLAAYLPPQTGRLGMDRQRSPQKHSSQRDGTKRAQPHAVQALLQQAASSSESLLLVSNGLLSVCARQLLQHLSDHLQQQMQATGSTFSTTSNTSSSSTPWDVQDVSCCGRHSHDGIQTSSGADPLSSSSGGGRSSSSSGAGGSCGRHSSSSSSRVGTVPAQQAQGGLLLHADWLELQQLEQVPGNPAAVQAILHNNEQLSNYWLGLGAQFVAVEQQQWLESGQSSQDHQGMQASSNSSSSSSSAGDNLGYQPSPTGSASVMACLRGATAAADAIEYSMAHMAQSTAMTSSPSDLETSARFRESRTYEAFLQVSAVVAAVRLCGCEALDFVAASLSASTCLLDAVPAVPESFWAMLPGSRRDSLISITWHTIAMFTQLAQQLICLLDQKGSQAAAANDKPYAPSADAGTAHTVCAACRTSSTAEPSPAAAGTAAAGALTAWQLQLARAALLETVLLIVQLLCDESVALRPGHGRGATPQELQHAAFVFQVIEAAVRWNERHVALRNHRAQALKGLETFLGRPVSRNGGFVDTQFSGALRALQAVMKHLLMPDQQPAPHVSSSEGQQLVQACLSLMLTGATVLQQKSHSPSLFEVDLCVKLLQLSMATESANDKQSVTAAAAAGTLSGTDAAATNSPAADQGQSSAQVQAAGPLQLTAAAMMLVGRYLISLGDHLCSLSATPLGTPSPPQTSADVLGWLVMSAIYLSRSELGAARGLEQSQTLSGGPVDIDEHILLLPAAVSQLSSLLNSLLTQQDLLGSLSAASGAPSHSSCSSSKTGSSSGAAASRQHKQPAVSVASSSTGFYQHLGASGTTSLAGQGWHRRLQIASQIVEDRLLDQAEQWAGMFRLSPTEQKEILGVVPRALKAAGRALCAVLPCSYCCNNPACGNPDTASAAFALVRGKACVCGGCLGGLTPEAAADRGVMPARYCSAACQAAHWRQHKAVCKEQRQLLAQP